jgi:hypothetical protein
VLRNATPEVMALAIAGGVDYVNSSYARKTDVEAIITTSMVFRNKYFFRSSDIYYINNADYHQYQNNKSTAKEIQLTSSQAL